MGTILGSSFRFSVVKGPQVLLEDGNLGVENGITLPSHPGDLVATLPGTIGFPLIMRLIAGMSIVLSNWVITPI